MLVCHELAECQFAEFSLSCCLKVHSEIPGP